MVESTQDSWADVSSTDAELIRGRFPLLERITDEALREAIVVTWVRQWRKSVWQDPDDCPHSTGLEVGGNFSLIKHTNVGLTIAVAIAEAMIDSYGVDVNMDRLLAIGHLHDVSKLCETDVGADGTAVRSNMGDVFPHATLGAVEAHAAGIDDLVCKSIILHPYHPPHTFIKPACLELLIYTWADHGAADGLNYLRGGVTHMEKRRLFEAIAG
jgi:hypothetical protein